MKNIIQEISVWIRVLIFWAVAVVVVYALVTLFVAAASAPYSLLALFW